MNFLFSSYNVWKMTEQGSEMVYWTTDLPTACVETK